MSYDKNKAYKMPFIGGPLDGSIYELLPSDRIVYPQYAENGELIMRHTYNLRECVNDKGEILQIEYVHQNT